MACTTTHDPRGGGRPRLIFAAGGRIQTREPQRIFDLLPGITRIGGSPSSDLCLSGLDDDHAEIRRDDTDNYTYWHLGTSARGWVHGTPVRSALLITGARIQLGPWTVSFYREEFADHGRPYGGRNGGEFAVQREQREPRRRGTSVSGGREQDADDPGEYY